MNNESPTILCTIRYPPRTVQVLLETYYRFMHYRVAYVTGTLPRLSTTPYGVLPPGQAYGDLDTAVDLVEGTIAFAVVEDNGWDAAWLARKGVQSFVFTEEDTDPCW